MLNKKDPLVDAVKQVIANNEKERNAVKSVNEAFGIQSKRQLPHEKHAAYDAALNKAIKGELTEAVKEELVGKQHKIDANKNKRIDSHDFKLLRAKKEKKPEEHGVEKEREMAAKGKKMYENQKINEIGDTPAGKKAINRVALRGDAEIADQAIKKRPNKKVLKKAERAVDLSIATHKRRGGNVLGGYVKSAYGVKEETRGKKIAESILAKIRGKKAKEEKIEEKAPPGAKFERMVKHIKDKYKSGGLSKQEKSIAYATAWKAKNKNKAKD